jgi:hypothetical protein
MRVTATSSAFFLLLVLTVGCAGPEGEAGGESGVPAAEAARADGSPQAAGQREAEVVAALQGLFDALGSGDGESLRSLLDPSVVMHFSETRDGTTTFGSSTVDDLVARVTASEAPLIERMWDPEVRIDGPLASIWTPYDFYVGSELSHCGIDVATFMDTPEGWRVVALSWTRLQPPACALHPDGPP